MKIRTKSFLIFQITVACVAAIVMSFYWGLISFFLSEPISACIISACIIYVIVSIIYFAIAVFPAWKLWRGNTWYSLSLLFLLSITIVFLVISALTLILDSAGILSKDTSLAIGWLCIIYYFIAAPANIIVACSIGLLGKLYFTTKYQTGI